MAGNMNFTNPINHPFEKGNSLIHNEKETQNSFFFLKALFLFTFFNILTATSTFAQTADSTEYISPGLRTVQLHREGWPFSYPIIRLNSDQTLLLTFDEPGTQVKSYYYTLVLCDKDWDEADLMTPDYLRGVPLQPLTDYSFAFNTTFDYVHYRLSFPNNDLQPLRSGNYLLKVFGNGQQENPVLVKKFMVVEPNVTIKSAIRNTASSSIRSTHHEIDFEVWHPGFTIRNPVNEVSVTIVQNGRTDQIITGLKPLFFRDGMMDFNYNRENLMEAGNEFRHLDLRSTRFLSEQVKELTFEDPFFHATVSTDFPRTAFAYQYRKDINGRFYIEVQEYDNAELEADYIFTHFSLQPENPSPFQTIYLNGALTNWQMNPLSQMVYNAGNQRYELTLLLKQGYYNYQYVVVENGQSSSIPIEGSFEQTENDYLILVYYQGIEDRYHRLIGAEVINSVLSRQDAAY